MGGKPQPISVPDYTGINLQTSAMSLPCPLGWGQFRGSPNLIDYTDFDVKIQGGGKGGLTGGKNAKTTYSATILLALVEGPIVDISKTYKDLGYLPGYSASGFAKFNGTTPQAPWSYFVTSHPERAYGYQGIAYLAGKNFDLGTSETIPALSFEIQGALYGTGYTGAGDADCALVVEDFLTNPSYGSKFPTAFIDTTCLLSTGAAPTTGDSAFQTYCRAMGWGFSPFINNQEAALSILARWCQITNTAPVWPGYTLKFVPWGDQVVTGNGVTYNPPTAAVFDFGDDDWLQEDGDDPADPLVMEQVDAFDANTAIAIDCSVRANDYNSVPIDYIDPAAEDLVGRRQASNISAREICELPMAQAVVSLICNRMVNIRNTWKGKLGPQHARREPMEVGYITDTKQSLIREPVRIRYMEEQDDGAIEFTFEEFPGTVGQQSTLAAWSGSGAPLNSQVAADPVQTPLIFEPNVAACAFLNNGSSSPLIVAAVCGGSGGVFDPNWGGYTVWVSTDNSTFAPLEGINGSAEVVGASRQGVLTGTFATYGGTNPDAVHTLSVSTAMSNADLEGASSGADAAAGATLCVIKDAGGTYELVGPETVTITGTNAYDLTTNYRGLLGTSPGAHVSGAQFARLDGSQFMAVLPAPYIGRTLYLKFQSFNKWGNGVEDLSTCTSYSYTPVGTGYGGGAGGVPTTPTGLTASAVAGAGVLDLTANLSSDNVTEYKFYRAPGTGASFGSAVLIGTGATNHYNDVTVAAASYTYFVVATNVVGDSLPSAGANLVASSSGGLWGFGWERDLSAGAPSTAFVDFASKVPWTIPASIPLGSVKITGTGPTAQTDFDLQANGVSVGTARFAIGATEATFIKAAPTSVLADQTTSVVFPANLNGMSGRMFGAVVGTR